MKSHFSGTWPLEPRDRREKSRMMMLCGKLIQILCTIDYVNNVLDLLENCHTFFLIHLRCGALQNDILLNVFRVVERDMLYLYKIIPAKLKFLVVQW